MKSNTSMMRIAKNLASVGILFTVSNMEGAQAASSQAQIKSVAESAVNALASEGAEGLAVADVEHMIHSHVDSLAKEHVSSN